MIIEKLDEWYLKRAVLERQEARVRPSSLGDCLRKQAWLLSGVEPLIDPRSERTFELGHQRGMALEEACTAIWPDARSQVPISIPLGKFKMEGTCDLWIPSLMTVVDFKTQATFGFGLLDTEGVSEEYKLQIHAYRDGLAQTIDPKSVRAIIVYEAKDSDARKGIKAQQLKEIEVPWTEDLEERYQVRLLELENMLMRRDRNVLDPHEYPELPLGMNGQRSWKCRFCSVGEERGECYK